jgi:tight adherence protein C
LERLDAAGTLTALELQRPLFTRLIRPLAARLAGLAQRLTSPRTFSRTSERLAQAGIPAGMRTVDFLGLKILSAVFLGGASFAMIVLGRDAPLGLAFVAIMAGIGFLIPEFWLGSRIRARRELITMALPNTLDLLTVSVQAGLGFDLALAKVVERTRGPLADEFHRTLAEIRVGRARREALADMASRNPVPALDHFISAVIQADQLGVPIGRVLQVQSEQLRVQRRQRAEEAAARTPVKMVFPLVGCILPSLFIVLLGPALMLLLQYMA